MKKTLILGLLAVGALSAYSQGTIIWNDNKTDFKILIYAPQVATPAVSTMGNSAASKPVGSTVYTGQVIGGTTTQSGTYNYSDGADYTVQLYAAPGLNDAVGSLVPVTQYISLIYSTTTAGAGLFLPVSPTSDQGIPSTPSGGATLAIAAWYNPGGTGANGSGTYATEALAAQAGVPAAISTPVNFAALGNLGSPASTAPDLGEGSGGGPANITSFSLAIVPEPSTIALGVIGASTFLFRRRK